MNKQAVLDRIIVVLEEELATLTRAANESFSAATDPDSKAENKYDTRSLEASYVARGQAQRVAEVQQAVQAFKAMSGTNMPEGSAINLGTLVTMQTPGSDSHYFIAPFGGGTEIAQEGKEVFVITPASPLGQKLMGKREGDVVVMPNAAKAIVTTLC